MSLYRQGLTAGNVFITPAMAHAQARWGMVSDGFGNIRRSEGRFYQRGITGAVVGAQTPGPLGTLADGVVGLLLDVAHVLLIFAGMYALWMGLHG